MKKSLSLLLALTLVFGLFASMASAADAPALTTAEKLQFFVNSGILKGKPDGQPHLEDKLSRAEFATIATAVAGLTAATSGQTFSDVKKGQWYYGAIEAAAKAGLVNGIGAGKFGPKTNVTVESIIKVAVTIAGLKPVAGATVAGSSAWAGPYVKAALDAGLIASQTSYTGQATRGDVITIAFAVVQLKSVPTLSDVKATVNADDTITVTGKVVGKADSVKVALGTATAVAATLKDDKTFTYTTAKQATGTYSISVVAYDGTKASAASTVSAIIDGFQVASVTVLNGKQLAVKFNKAVQEGNAAGGHNVLNTYALNGAAPVATTLSADKMTVTLTFAPFVLDSYAQIEVNKTVGTTAYTLNSASGKALTSYKAAIQLTDKTAPTVTGVSYAGKTATVTFSEPIPALTLGTLSINGSDITATPSSSVYYTANEDLSDARHDVSSVTINGLAVGTNYSFYLIGGADIAGNRFDYNTTLTVPSDSTAPTITALTVSGQVLTATFSEKVSTAGSVYLADGSGVTAGVPSADGLSATYTVSWLGSNSFLNVTAVVKGYKDLVGNAGADFSKAITISKDTTKPTVSSVFYTGTDVVIQFSEAVTINSTASNVTYKYTDTNSVVYNGTLLATSAIVGYDANNNGNTTDSGENFYVKLPTSALGSGKYVVSIPTGLVKDGAVLTNDAASATITVNGTTGSGVITVGITSPSNGKLVFVFNKDLTTAALDVSKYTINDVALPAGTVLYFDSNLKTVVAELPAGAIAVTGSRVVKVINVVDGSGNTMSSTNSAVVLLNENVAPVAQSVAINSDKQIAVTFSETLGALPATVSGVTVYINGSATATTIDSFDKSNNVLLLNTTASTFATSQTIKVTFASSNVVDMKGNAAANGSVSK